MHGARQDKHGRNVNLRKARTAAKAGEESLAAGNTARALTQFNRALCVYAAAGVKHSKIQDKIAQLVRPANSCRTVLLGSLILFSRVRVPAERRWSRRQP